MKRIDRLLIQAKQLKNKKNKLNQIVLVDKIDIDLYRDTKGKIYTKQDLDNFQVAIIDDIDYMYNTINKWKNREITQNRAMELIGCTDEEFIDDVSYTDDLLNKWDKRHDLSYYEYHDNRKIITKEFIDGINSVPITN